MSQRQHSLELEALAELERWQEMRYRAAGIDLPGPEAHLFAKELFNALPERARKLCELFGAAGDDRIRAILAEYFEQRSDRPRSRYDPVPIHAFLCHLLDKVEEIAKTLAPDHPPPFVVLGLNPSRQANSRICRYKNTNTYSIAFNSGLFYFLYHASLFVARGLPISFIAPYLFIAAVEIDVDKHIHNLSQRAWVQMCKELVSSIVGVKSSITPLQPTQKELMQKGYAAELFMKSCIFIMAHEYAHALFNHVGTKSLMVRDFSEDLDLPKKKFSTIQEHEADGFAFYVAQLSFGSRSLAIDTWYFVGEFVLRMINLYSNVESLITHGHLSSPNDQVLGHPTTQARIADLIGMRAQFEALVLHDDPSLEEVYSQLRSSAEAVQRLFEIMEPRIFKACRDIHNTVNEG